jgi:Domain of unknown function (DUF5134)
MMVPGLILDIFATVMLVVAGVSTARLITARAWRGGDPEGDIDVAHALMGIAMAGMLTARLATLPNGVWAAVFGVLTAWFGYQVTRDSRGRGARAVAGSHHTPHLVHSAAMLYMFVALAPAAGSGAAGMAGMGGSSGQATRTLSLPIVALIFAFLLAGYAVRDLDRISGPAAHGHYHLAGAALAQVGGALAGASAGAESPALAFTGPVAADGGRATVAPPPPGGTRQAAPANGSASGRTDMARRLVFAPGVVTGCRIAMGITMALMLAIMI